MFSSSNNPRPSSASHSAPFSLSFTHMTKMSNYSALTDPHCILTRSTNFRQHFTNLVGPYSLAASLCVKPNLDLDYSKKSVRDRVRPMTANGATRGEVRVTVTTTTTTTYALLLLALTPNLTPNLTTDTKTTSPSENPEATSQYSPADRPFLPQKASSHASHKQHK